jgi:hypothetical protein
MISILFNISPKRLVILAVLSCETLEYFRIFFASLESGKIAKGFTPGSSTPGSSFASIKKHAARTLIRYGKASKGLVKKYGSRSQRKDRGVKPDKEDK